MEIKSIKEIQVSVPKLFEVGQEVWLRNTNTGKMAPPNIGPFIIIKINSEFNNYQMQTLSLPLKIKSYPS